MDKQVKIIKITTIISIILMFACIIILTCQLIKINTLKEKTSALEQQKDILIEQIYDYNSTNSCYNNNREEYLENYAREMLGWGEKDEIWYTKK